jgi:hypothetical protein
MRLVSRKSFFSIITLSVLGIYFSRCKNKLKNNYLYFSESETIVMEKWAEVILPERTDKMPSVEEAEVIRRLDEEFSFVSPDIQEEFHSAILVLNVLPFFYNHWTYFENLSFQTRKKFLEQVSQTESDIVRAVIGNLKLVTFLAYYGHKSTWNQIGYDGPFGNPPEKWSETRIYYKSMIGEKK